MSYGYPDVDFKSGGDATATAEGYQANVDPTKMFNKGVNVGVANPACAEPRRSRLVL